MTRTRRAWRAAAALVVALAPCLLHGLPAGAGTEAAITLVSQDAWTLVGGDFHAKLGVEGAAPGASIAVVAHQPLPSRSAFDSTLEEEEELGSLADSVFVPVDALPLDADGNRDLTLRLEVVGGTRLVETLGARRAGVYPLEVELRDADEETLAGFVTYLVVVAPAGVDGAITTPLDVAWVWPLSAQPATLPGGGSDPDVVRQLRPDGRLGRQAAALARTAGVPVTIVPGPETLEAWDASAANEPSLAEGVTAIRNALGTHQVIASTYVPVDLPSLLRAAMIGAVEDQIVGRDEALRRFFGTRIDPGTALARPVDGAALIQLLTRGVDRMIVETDALVEDDSQSAPARPFLLEPPPSLVPGGPVPALAADSGLARLLSADVAPALRAQRLLAGLSVVAFEESEERHAVTIVNPAQLDPSDELIDAVLNGLRANPILTPMTVDAVFEQLPIDGTDDEPDTRELAAYNPPAPPVSAVAYDSARIRRATLQDLAPAAGGLALAQHALRASVSSAWTPDDAARAEAELASVEAVISGFLSRIQVPNPSTITLTDRSGEIPLTFRNDTDQTVTVLIELQSPKLSFPDGVQQIVELKPRNTTVRIAVEARTSGSFPLRVTVSSLNGILTIAEAQLDVRATAVSAVGLVLIIGAVVFLALWWMTHIHRERARRRQGAAVAEPAT